MNSNGTTIHHVTQYIRLNCYVKYVTNAVDYHSMVHQTIKVVRLLHAHTVSFLPVAAGLKDPDARDQCLISLLHSLPLTHFRTAIYILKHLKW